ncbi:MAG: hypothetical protein ACRD2H_11690 [Terriglobales bacterium]
MSLKSLLLAVLVGTLALPVVSQNESASQDHKQRDALGALTWRNLGPAVAGGRVAAVAGVPGNPLVYYAGAAGGGVWKTTDGGFTWKAIFTKEPVTSIGAIALAPSNPNLVWVGTGEANIRNDVIAGRGVYFSPDAGATWKFMGLADAGQIGRIVVSPTDPNTVFVAVLGHAWAPNDTRGVYRTTDGGKTWQRVLYVDDNTGAIDVVMEPGNPMVLLAAMWQVRRYPWTLDDGGPGSGIYRSLDGGTTWTKLTNGLPTGPLGRIGLAMAPSDPQRIYALLEAKDGRLWTSDDLGDHWTMVSNSHQIDGRPWYFSRVEVAPNDPNRIYFLSVEMFVSQDGGKTVKPMGRGVHSDNHDIWIDPKNPERMIEGNDGGVVLSTDGGGHWRFLADLPIEQFYQVAADSKLAYDVCGGLQDNSAWCGPTRSGFIISGNEWHPVVGGDGEYSVPAPSDPDIIYSDSQNGSISRLDLKTGLSRYIRPYIEGVEDQAAKDLKYRFNWTTPIAVSDTDANTVYIGGNVLFKSTDGGLHWMPISPDLTRNDKSKQEVPGGDIEYDISGAETYDTILSFRISPVDSKVIWVGTDDGLVQVTKDGGAHWTNVTANIPNLPEWGRVQQIEASPFDPATGYVAVDFHETDNMKPYVFKTHDYGQTWTAISAGLPQDEPARVIREDPNQKGFLVVGTNTGLFYSTDDGGAWQPLKGNLPTVTVYDLLFVKRSHDLVAATHGRGLWVLDNLTPLEGESPAVEASTLHVFPALPGVMLNLRPLRTPSISSFTTPNPPGGVVIDYYLKSQLKATPQEKTRHQTPVKITITDAKGDLVNTLYGPAEKGINRISWMMNYAGATPLTFVPRPEGGGGFRRRSGGPEVVPGTYKVTVSAAGESQAIEAQVRPDPRLPVNMANFEANTRFALRVRNEVSALNQMINRLHDLHTQLTSVEKMLQPPDPEAEIAPGHRQVLEQARVLAKKVEAMEETVYNDKLQPGGEDDLHYLAKLHDLLSQGMYGASPGYDLPLRQDMIELQGQLRQQLDASLTSFNSLLRTEVAAFNKMALQHNAGTLYAGAPIELKASGGGM